MRHPIHRRHAFGMFHFQARHKQGTLAAGAEGKGNRAFCGNEGKTGEIEDVGAVKKHDPGQVVIVNVLQQGLGTAVKLSRMNV
ncbi:MAG: hypothetical protein R3E31_12385 [Chloroflexota bacterium]